MRKLTVAMILGLAISMMAALPALAQADLTESFTTPDGSLSLSYPSGWMVDEFGGAVFIQQPGADGFSGITIQRISEAEAALGFTPDMSLEDAVAIYEEAASASAAEVGMEVNLSGFTETTFGDYRAFVADVTSVSADFTQLTIIGLMQVDGQLILVGALAETADVLEALRPFVAPIAGSIQLDNTPADTTTAEQPIAAADAGNLTSLGATNLTSFFTEDYDIVFIGDGAQFAVNDGTSVQIIDTATIEIVNTLTTDATPEQSSDVAISPDGTLIAAAFSDVFAGAGGISVWDVASGEIVFDNFDILATNSIAFSADGTQLVAGGQEGTLTIFNTTDGSIANSISLDDASIDEVVYLGGNLVVGSNSTQSSILIINPVDGAIIAAPQQFILVNDIAVDDNGVLFAVALDSFLGVADVQLYLPDGTLFRDINAAPLDSTSVALSPDGTLLATGSSLGVVRVVDTATGESVAVLNLSGVEDESDMMSEVGFRITGISFSPDGRLLVVAGDDTNVRVFGLE